MYLILWYNNITIIFFPSLKYLIRIIGKFTQFISGWVYYAGKL